MEVTEPGIGIKMCLKILCTVDVNIVLPDVMLHSLSALLQTNPCSLWKPLSIVIE